MTLRAILSAASLLAFAGAGAVAWAQARIEGPRVEIDIPDRRPDPRTGADMVELVGGLFALKDGYDRSRRGHVCVLTYEDRNGNGRRDRGEGPLPGWSFAIADAAGATVAQGQTGKEGRFCNERPLEPGAYSVRQSPGGGWTNTEPGAPSVDVKQVTLPAEQSVTVLFGNCRGEGCARELRDERRDDPRDEPRGDTRAGPGDPTPQGTSQLCVVKYQDYDGDGVRDADEPGLPGWIFSVKTTGGAMLAFGTTNAQGEWCAGSLPAGAVNVFETPQTGWTSTDPANVASGTAATKPAVLVANQTTNVVFGNKTARVCVTKYNDLNGNGVQNAGEGVLAGWTFTLQGIYGQALDSGVTDAQGRWCSTAVLPVNYPVSVVETQQPGWWNTAPGGMHKLSPTPTVILTMTEGQTANVKFGNYVPPATGKVCVRKFRDHNSDGYDGGSGGEPGLPGWTFTLVGPAGSVTLVTGADGSACTPANLAPGSYTVTETLQSGWTNTNPGDGTASKVVTVNPVGVANVVFGNSPVAPGIICATKYRSVDNNSWFDPATEPLLGAGWTIEVRNASGALVASGTTNAQGRWCTPTPLPAGTYTVNEVQQSGWVNADPAGPPHHPPPYFKTAVVSATRGADLFFGNLRSGRVCITKYNDINANGQRDPGEPVMSGFSFHFQTNGSWWSDIVLTTGPTGVVCLDLAPWEQQYPGDGYHVWEVLKPGWVVTEPVATDVLPANWQIFEIFEGQTTNLVFGNHDASTSGRICVAKFNDLNNNGVRNAGEPLLPYWQFNVTGPSGPLSGTTGANGTWCTLQVLTAGTYTVTEVTKPGWIRTAPTGPTAAITQAVVNGQTTNFNFGNRLPGAPARVCVTKYNDANNNGVRDPGEAPMYGWTFSVRNAAGGLDDTGVTSLQPYFGPDPTGVWCSTQPLAAGPATVVETQKPGWTSQIPGGATPTRPITLVAGQTTNVEFGNYHVPPAPGRVCAVKFHDLDGDGVRDPGEGYLAGWAFTVSGAGGAPLSGVTGEDGMICWERPPGTYSVSETLQAGWDSTVPGGPTPTLTTTVASAQSQVLEFGNRQTPKPGDICVTKYQDLDADGVRDPGEPPLSGWTFTLSSGQSGVTGPEGRVCFTVPEGEYTVTETMQPGWVSSDPGGPNPSKPVKVIAGETAKPFFGNRSTLPPAPGKVCIVKYNDLNGDGARQSFEPALLGWSFNLKTTAGAQVAALTTGAAPADYCRDLPPGTYRAEEVTQTGWTNTDPTGAAPQKPFTIVSGQTVNLVFGNRQNPPAPQLSIEKFNDSGPTACGPNGVNNPCVFRIRITNIGTGPYAGSATFSDSMRVLTLPPAANSMALLSVGPAGWSCSPTGAPMTCTGPVNLAAGQSVDIAVSFNFAHPVRPTRNCVTLTAPIVLPEVCLPL